MANRRNHYREIRNKPKICSVIYGDTAQDLQQMADKADSLGSDLLEIRIDLCKKIPVPPPKLGKLPIILTARSTDEGGKMVNDDRRQEILESILKSNHAYVDLEISTDMSGLEIPTRKEGHIIFSQHWFDQTPPASDLIDLVQRYGEHGIVKLIPTASQFQDNVTILKFVQDCTEQGYKLVSFCMGEQGIISRILSPLAGSLFTYSTISKPVAPGQLSTSQVLSIYNAIRY